LSREGCEQKTGGDQGARDPLEGIHSDIVVEMPGYFAALKIVQACASMSR
jgi:hypothetical protein